MVVRSMTQREKDIECFYSLLDQLEERVGGKRMLMDCHWNMGWPRRGVYFFFEEGETRSGSESNLRVVRVGTHAVTAKSKSRLWNRLYEHKQDGGRSVFRNHVNRALRNKANGKSNACSHNHSRCISAYIGRMPFLWVNVNGENSHRKRIRIESNAIKLLSNWSSDTGDRSSDDWLGHHSGKIEISRSGLWNIQQVKGKYAPSFLDQLKECVNQTGELNDLADDWDSPMCVT